MALEAEHIKLVGDGASLCTVLGTLTGALPNIAAILSITWTLYRFWESQVLQKLWASLKRKIT